MPRRKWSCCKDWPKLQSPGFCNGKDKSQSILRQFGYGFHCQLLQDGCSPVYEPVQDGCVTISAICQTFTVTVFCEWMLWLFCHKPSVTFGVPTVLHFVQPSFFTGEWPLQHYVENANSELLLNFLQLIFTLFALGLNILNPFGNSVVLCSFFIVREQIVYPYQTAVC